MEYFFEQGEVEGKYLLLLHGTGGDEHSLVDVAKILAEDPTILAFRGDVKDNGLNRFFCRNEMNQFDIPSLEEQTDNLLSEITFHSEKKGIPVEDWILVGYSNGANIAAHLLLERKTPVKAAILFHPMFLGVATQDYSLVDKKIWLSYGYKDPIVTEDSLDQLEDKFRERQADVTKAVFETGHQVTIEELVEAKNWLEQTL
ncbi:phospholipase/carboxylesterase [Enterococcus sp. PF1-24]|uniref:alpha/beta hydrolase n=1 Tax=unclassified Enterococcus TaxID=2608891 RepID=UPI0024730C02|nr:MULTISPECIES: alpha/beta hydrolase [unclassified Enterococcus]MDH6363724.1 phospholipase/carboxylesterase [Enterococcus sp. PFB1-1]MDH6400680.1 phospholipase/carboxylesterase [Enterococcus sp. PF1-24]